MKKNLVVAFFCMISLGALATSSQAYELSFIPSSKGVEVGEVRTVQIYVGGVAPDKLGAFDIVIEFDPNLVAFRSDLSSFGGPLIDDQLACPGLPTTCTYWGSFSNFEGQSDATDSSIRLTEVSYAPADDLATHQAAAFTLATLAFQGLERGVSPLHVDLGESVLADSFGNAVPFTARDGSLIVPEPPSLLLVLGGIGALLEAFNQD